MRITQYKDVAVNACYDSGIFQGFDVMVLDYTSYAPRKLDEYLSRDQIDGLAALLATAAESTIKATEDAPEPPSQKQREKSMSEKRKVTMDDALARLVRIMGTFDLATGHADTMDQALDALEAELRDVLGHLRARREQQREKSDV